MSLKTTLIAAGCALAAFVAVGGLALHYKHKAAVEHARADAAVADAKLATATIQVVDHYHETTRLTHEIVEKEADAVQSLPGAQTPIDPVRRAGLCASLSRLRDGAAACADPGPGGTTSVLPEGEGGAAPSPG